VAERTVCLEPTTTAHRVLKLPDGHSHVGRSKEEEIISKKSERVHNLRCR
jgi:hypothetical protein